MGLDKTSFLLIKNFLLPHSFGQPKILIAGRPKVFFSKSIAEYIIPEYPFSSQLPYYAESLIAFLFSVSEDFIHILDRSNFEGASITFDLSQTPSFSLDTAHYDIVLDLGTSEHVSSPVNSVFNLLSFVKPGGLYLCISPHTNNPDHGLVTFSRSFFESLDLLPQLTLVNHFVYKESVSSIPSFTVWDCDTNQFRAHLPGLDGSCFSNVLSLLNLCTNHFVLYKVVAAFDDLSVSLGYVNQLVYLRRYGDDDLLVQIPMKYRSTIYMKNIFLLKLLMKFNSYFCSLFILCFYMRSVRLQLGPS